MSDWANAVLFEYTVVEIYDTNVGNEKNSG